MLHQMLLDIFQVRVSPGRKEPMKELVVGGESQTHSSQHFPGTLTLRGMGQSGLGSRTSMPQSGTQPTAPSRQVHWYLQLLWKDSPLRYTFPPNTQEAPSRAIVERSEEMLSTGEVVVRKSLHFKIQVHNESLPVQTPMRRLFGDP